jgi:hypothetical protein
VDKARPSPSVGSHQAAAATLFTFPALQVQNVNLKLAYIAIETNKFDEWREFSKVIGYQYESAGDAACLRMDSRARRVILVKGDSEDYAYSGLEMDSKDEFEAVIARLRAAGVIEVRPVKALNLATSNVTD